MGFLSVIGAAAAGWIFGALWYMALAKPWVEAAGIEVDDNGRPVNNSAAPYILSALMMIVVAGMMRHTFASSGIDTTGKGFLSGLGIGAFFITPWIAINNAYTGRPHRLTQIDAGYAIFGCAVIGLVLTLLG